MTYEFHNDTLIILFSMLLMSGILCFIQMLPTPSEVRGLQNANHLNIKYVSTQNANVNNNNTIRNQQHQISLGMEMLLKKHLTKVCIEYS